MRNVFLVAFLLVLAFSASAQNKNLDLTVPDESGSSTVTIGVELDSGIPLTIGPDGNVTATGLTRIDELCSEYSAGQCEGVQVEIEQLQVNGQSEVSIFPNEALNFSWRSRGSWECRGSGLDGTDWNGGPKLPDGTQTISSPGLDPGATYPVSLVCANGTVESTPSVVTVNVIEPDPVPEGCEGRNPEHLTRARSCIHSGTAFGADCYSYAEVFGNELSSFPGSEGSNRNFILNRGEYAAMQFIVPQDFNREGGFNVTEAQFGVGTAGGKIWSISKCPGDFDRDAISAESTGRCYIQGSGSTSILYQPEGGGDPFRCELERGATYYMNLIFTDSAAGTAPADLNWWCPNGASTCGHILSVISRTAN